MKLQYKTRGNSSPQGKPRVYFSCHPADFELYFQSISEEILEKQNCAIWYDTEPEAEYDSESFKLSLSQMQLFVIPVTTRFLCQENRALSVELPFAMEQQIPVLPLMQESGLEELFNGKCGNLQMLDKFSKDKTAIRYEEKLEKYLSSVLTGDELSRRIRDAFTAYIFLSYRKTDRKYAQELMRLIHENDFCRDMAIWYDEFLSPGEDFNDNIRQALEKSSLFALVVTPNIVKTNALEEDNFVVKTEYPLAKDSGKIIFPAEFRSTDRRLLAEKFPGILTCVDARAAHDEEAFCDALRERVEKISRKKQESTPVQEYLIGLAYLNGVDMEVDRGRALAMITDAARKGEMEAVEKLVDMYRTGDGVERNPHTAIQWQIRLVELCQGKFAERRDLDSGFKWASQAVRLSDFYLEVRDLDAAGGQLERLREHRERLASAEDLSGLKYTLSSIYERLGDVARNRGHLEEAMSYYEKGRSFSWELNQADGTVESARDYLSACRKMADIYLQEGMLDQAEEGYQAVQELCRQMSEMAGCDEDEKLAIRRSAARNCQDLGDVYRERGESAKAGQSYEKALESYLSLWEEFDAVEDKGQVACICGRMAIIRLQEDKLKEAEDYGIKSLELYSQLSDETQMMDAKRDYGVGCLTVGEILLTGGRTQEADRYFDAGIQVFRQLSEETRTVGARRDLSESLARLGYLYRMEGNRQEAENCFVESLGLRQELYAETGTAQMTGDLGKGFREMGEVLMAQGSLEEAEQYYETSKELYESLQEGNATLETRHLLAVACERLGDVAQAKGQLLEAEEHYREGLKAELVLKGETDSMEVKEATADLYGKLGVLYQTSGNLAEAERYFLEALQLYRQLIGTGNISDKNLQFFTHARLQGSRSGSCNIYSRINHNNLLARIGLNYQLAERPREAESYYLESLTLCRELNQEAGNAVTRTALSCSCERMGDICLADGRLQEAERYHGEGLEIRRRLWEETRSLESKRFLAISCEKMAQVYSRTARADQALECYEESLNLFQQLVQEAGTVESHDDLASIYYEISLLLPSRTGRNMYREACRIWKRLTQICPDAPQYAYKLRMARKS